LADAEAEREETATVVDAEVVMTESEALRLLCTLRVDEAAPPDTVDDAFVDDAVVDDAMASASRRWCVFVVVSPLYPNVV
jgi:hypothetical protein